MNNLTRTAILTGEANRPKAALPLHTSLNGSYKIGQVSEVLPHKIVYWAWHSEPNRACLIHEWFIQGQTERKSSNHVHIGKGASDGKEWRGKCRTLVEARLPKELLSHLRKPKDFFEANNTFYWMTDPPATNTLEDRLQSKGSFLWYEALSHIDPIFGVLEHFHKMKISHNHLDTQRISYQDEVQSNVFLNWQDGLYALNNVFLPPEGRLEGFSPQTDVYGMAAIIAMMLPHSHTDTKIEEDPLFRELLADGVEHPEEKVLAANISLSQKKVLLTALKTKPEERYPTLGAFRLALAQPDSEAATVFPPTIHDANPIDPVVKPVAEPVVRSSAESGLELEEKPNTARKKKGSTQVLELLKSSAFRRKIWIGIGGMCLIIVAGWLFWNSNTMQEYRYESLMREGETALNENRILEAHEAFVKARDLIPTTFVQERVENCEAFVEKIQFAEEKMKESWYAKAIASYEEAAELFPNAPEPQERIALANEKMTAKLASSTSFVEQYIAAHNDHEGRDLHRLFDDHVQYKGQRSNKQENIRYSRGEFVTFIRKQLGRYESYTYSADGRRVEPSLNLNRYLVFFDLSFSGVGKNTGINYSFKVEKQLTLIEKNGEMKITYDGGTIVYSDSYNPYEEYEAEGWYY